MTTENNIHTPIHTGSVNGQPVRFFKTPMNDGRPDFPWHSTDDLMKACGLGKPDERAYFLGAARSDWKGCIRTVDTTEAVVAIAPHYVAQGLIGAMIEVGRAPGTAGIEYSMAASKAMQVIIGELVGQDSLDFTIEALHRWGERSAEPQSFRLASCSDEKRESFATPYGALILPTIMDVDGKDEPMMSAEDTAVLLGIHGAEKQRAFAQELRDLLETGGAMDPIVEKFGGGKPARIAICPPIRPIYPTIPHDRGVGDATGDASLRDAVDSWVTIATEQARWHERGDVLLDCVARQFGEFTNIPRDLAGSALSNIITAVLENLGETEVECVQQAAMYAVSAHSPWRAAGREWLFPYRKTWVRDWIKDRPVYRRLARLAGMAHSDVPSWLKEVL